MEDFAAARRRALQHVWRHRILFFILVLAAGTSAARGQSNYTENLSISARIASSWASGSSNILQLQGPVVIRLDDNVKCTADRAVIWLTPVPQGLLAEQNAQIVLIGAARLEARDNHLTRSGNELLVNTIVRGNIEMMIDAKFSRDLSESPLYQEALSLRDNGEAPPEENQAGASTEISTTSAPPAAPVGGTSISGVIQPPVAGGGQIYVKFEEATQSQDDQGRRIYILSGGVSITQTKGNGDFIALSARNVVLFTDVAGKGESMATPLEMGQQTKAAYLEGDVRMDFVPAVSRQPEQRLTADRVYYDFRTERAILTAVVFHSIDPKTQIPVTVRARVMQRLASGEFSANNVQFTTSQFAVPTFSIGASYAYVHEVPQEQEYYNIESRNDVLKVEGVPIFYWPGLGGTLDSRPLPLRNFSIGNNSRYGFTVTSNWGLFETLGQDQPKDVDIDYSLNYFADRGFGGGFNGTYKGGFITDSDDPFSFQGDFKSYIMTDRGIDELGGVRSDVVPPTDIRGRFLWEHEQFLPDDWQVQVRLGYVSDPTFLEEWYQSEFDNGLPYDAEFYLKRQQDNEALTFLAATDTTRFITNADRQQEQFDVARLPEIGYQRIGESVLDDNLTLYSNNTGDGLKFDQSAYSLQEQGFYPGLSPGLPSDGFTGTTDQPVYRADTRQEVDWPVALGEFKVVPYVFGRITAYSASPQASGLTRLYDGAGVRLTTTFWRVDDSVSSDLLNLHRIRHIIQPEVNFFSTATTVDESRLYIFDPNVDAINDITGAQIALHQHWETMRGGPGRWESVDFLDWNIEADLYPHEPPPAFYVPLGFRGLFFPSMPETSVPRQAINTDLTWHIGDDTAFISDVQWNLDTRETAIAEGGLAVNRGSRLSYYIGDAYIQALESQVFSFNISYNLTAKYSMNINESLEFGQARAAVTYLTLIRRFDVVAVSVSVFRDQINNVNGFYFNIFPAGQPGFSTPWRAND